MNYFVPLRQKYDDWQEFGDKPMAASCRMGASGRGAVDMAAQGN
jgi:hypothetical protein